ncbi:MAG: hypothetical protein ACPLKP_00080 [Microgenomates group bacterium]
MGIKERVVSALQKIGEGLTLVDEDGQPNYPIVSQTVALEIEEIAKELWEVKNSGKPWMFFPFPQPKNSSNPDKTNPEGTQIGYLFIKWTRETPPNIGTIKVYPVFRNSSGNLSLGSPFFEQIKIHLFSPLYPLYYL